MPLNQIVNNEHLRQRKTRRRAVFTILVIGFLLIAWKSGLLDTTDPVVVAVALGLTLVVFNAVLAFWVLQDSKKYPQFNSRTEALLVFFWSLAGLEDYLNKRDQVAAKEKGDSVVP